MDPNELLGHLKQYKQEVLAVANTIDAVLNEFLLDDDSYDDYDDIKLFDNDIEEEADETTEPKKPARHKPVSNKKRTATTRTRKKNNKSKSKNNQMQESLIKQAFGMFENKVTDSK